MRPYTGFDGIGQPREGLEEFVRRMQTDSNTKVWNNGTFGVRKKRGANAPQGMQGFSVHSTGRAADISRRNWNGRKGCTRAEMIKVIDWLIVNADNIGLEYLADYEQPKAGRGWRCDREEWQTYGPGVITSGGFGDWIHIELDDKHANTTDWINKVMGSFPLTTGKPSAGTWETCRKGDEGDNVRQVQQVLKDAGYKNSSGKKPIVVDGVFLDNTDKRVREYQKANGLKVDGIVGPITAGHMGLI